MQELTHTPGTSESLGLFQTIRLRAIDEAGRDVSDSLIEWQSSQPHVVAVSSTGLVQRLRDDTSAVEISARVFELMSAFQRKFHEKVMGNSPWTLFGSSKSGN